jgi:beta-hydroxylase
VIDKYVRHCEERIRRAPGGNRAFFESQEFRWVSRLEANWRDIRQELDQLLAQRESIPNFQDISKEQAALTEGEQWKTLFLYAYGHKAEANCSRCPRTTELLRLIPGMKTAMFSILAPGKHIPEHRGPYNGVLRFHLGLLVPDPPSSCRLRVRDEIRSWEEGKGLIFDDSYIHEVWNDSSQYRVVLFVDFVRPLPFPLSLANQLVIWLISISPFVKQGMENIRRMTPPPRSAGEPSPAPRP